MGTVHHLNPPRTLAHIIAEILLDEGRITHLGQSEADEIAWGILDDRINANKAEAKAIITNLTGIDWQELEAALHA